MDRLEEAKKPWGGSWTEEKLDAFEKYVDAYLKIMSKQKENWLKKIIYFDGFAGCGDRIINDDVDLQDYSLFPEEEKKDSLVYQGSPERVLKLDKKFDEYIFNDINESYIEQLKNNLQQKNYDLINCKFVVGDVNSQIQELSKKLDYKTAALVFLDPFGMQINMKSIEKLKNKRVDLWILVPTGVAINRLLDNKCKLRSSDKLEQFYGLTEQNIKEILYENVPEQPNLFDDCDKNNSFKKKRDAVKNCANLYTNQLKKIFEFVEEPLELRNNNNNIIYHLIFASNNKTALKIANYIISKKRTK